MGEQLAVQGPRERIRKVFEFLKAFTELRSPPVRHIENQTKVLWLDDLPSHPCVQFFRSASHPEGESETSDVVLRIIRPTLTACPSPPSAITDWVVGWENIDNDTAFRASRNVPDRTGRTRIERFEEEVERVTLFKRWRTTREEWRVNERPARRCMALFQTVYEWVGIQEREPERIEILAGDGLLNCADGAGEFNHPVLLQKLELDFYPEKRNPEFVFRNRELPPELYLEFLGVLPGANYRQIAQCADELKETEISPFGNEDTEGFLQRLIQGVFPPDGQLIAARKDFDNHPERPAEEQREVDLTAQHFPVIVVQNGDHYELSNPEASRITGPISTFNLDSSLRRLREHGWAPTFRKTGGPTMERKPVIFMRERQSGLGHFLDLILEDIEKRVDFPTALIQIVGLAGAERADSPDGSPLLSLRSKDDEILLSKPANKEQLEIARQLARRDCVLVQGPPGTGKTHTIANLLGHLLAQGKSVLVTAHTPKALRVLRQKVVDPLQPLCLSVLQNDKQSQEELRQSVRLIHAGLSQDDRLLEREAERLEQSRARIMVQLREDRTRLSDAIQDETRAVVFGGNEVRPTDAAKRVKQESASADWIPSPVTPGAVMPLSQTDIVALYHTNARVTPEDERELNAVRPDVATLPTPNQFRELIDEMTFLRSQNLGYRSDLWGESTDLQQSVQFDRMLALSIKAIDFLRDRTLWELDAIQAGRDGGQPTQIWRSLIQVIESTWREVNDCQVLLMAHGPRIRDPRSPNELLPIIDKIIEHIEAGKSFGLLTKLTKPNWQQLIDDIGIGNHGPSLGESTHFRAVRALLRTRFIRQELVERWQRQITDQGGPTVADLGEKPELACRQFIPLIQACLDWHSSTWLVLEEEFKQLGFDWQAYLQSTPPQTGDNCELRQLRDAVLGDLQTVLQARAGWLRLQHLQQLWDEWLTIEEPAKPTDAVVARRLRQGLHDAEPTIYRDSYEELIRLKNLEPALETRRTLLKRLEQIAPAWASAVQNRHPSHSSPEPPGEPQAAWEWRQMHDELERRANVSIEEIQRRIETFNRELLDVTSQLVEKLTWIFLIRKTTSAQKQALGSYAAMRNRLTKTGKGVQDADMRAGARRAMSVARGAVPVWIMPLNEVAESFDPRHTRFDVVIIDEASQCDPTAMFALYLGQQTIIVGDDEQVTPVAAGVKMEPVQKLQQVHLQEIPFKELYDGQTSIYEFGQIAFGGVIRLIEHFRCAPNIIAFSNSLSYDGEIKPLREASSISLSRHVLPYRVEEGLDRSDEVNSAEAEGIASLICAAIEQPEYARNADDHPV